ncbi:MAG: RdgB/HAM1 family non-canonical purine NTP pyrophosphatase [Hyphomonadaceae bacterium]
MTKPASPRHSGLGNSGRLVVASHNAGKVREIGALLAPMGVEAISAGALGLAEPEETEATFIGNAKLKAEAAAAAAGLPALADDSGLEAFGLNGAPGIYSARWAGPDKDFAAAMARVWRELEGNPNKDARFVCALALAQPGTETRTFEGEVRGRLVWPPRGDKGFGYDPMFIPQGHDITFGEMAAAEKHAMSHRARAFAKLVEALS